jgi:hypothetical protein
MTGARSATALCQPRAKACAEHGLRGRRSESQPVMTGARTAAATALDRPHATAAARRTSATAPGKPRATAAAKPASSVKFGSRS